jgi:ABC-2 type transport system permease protein
MIFAVFYRDYRIRTTSLTWMFFDFAVPLMYLLVFGIGLDRALGSGVRLGGSHVSYQDFFLGGVLAMTSFGIAINTSYGFFVDRDNGIFYEFLTYPMTRGEFLVGKILFNCALALIQCLIILVLAGILLGTGIQWGQLPVLVLWILVGTGAWFFFLTIFALRMRRNDMFNTVINLLYFILLFAGSVFYPIDDLPGWMQVVALVNPLTWHSDLLRAATIGVGDSDLLFRQGMAFVLFTGVSFFFAIRALRRSVEAS